MNQHRRGKRPIRKRNLIMLALYAVILIVMVTSALVWDRPATEETFGSLEGRFDSDIELNYNQKTVHYREYEITNYLIIGMDRDELGFNGYQNGGQADFLLVLSIDRRNQTITPVMIDRDTMTPVTMYGIFGDVAGTRTMQVCLAQAFSGVDVTGSENTCRAVSGLLGGVKIDRCLLMDLNGIVLLNDAIGGVTVTLEDDLTALHPSLEKGETVKLVGELAEHFVRGRMTVADGTNESRMRRQQTYIEAMLEQMKLLIEEDDRKLEEVLNSMSGHVETSTDASILVAEADAYSSYEWKPMKMLPGWHRKGDDGFTEFWTDEPALMDIIVDVWFQ